jgi:hypothetical protein
MALTGPVDLHFARTRLRSGAWIIAYRGYKDENRNWKWFESGRDKL